MIKLDVELNSILAKYAVQVEKAAKQAVDEVATSGATELTTSSPARTGRYAGNWTTTPGYKSSMYVRTVHNSRPTYRLTHLLERGHATRNGGRVAGRPHIKPAEERMKEAVEERMRDLISKYGT